MQVLDNINVRFGDDLAEHLLPGCRLRIAAPAFSMFAFEQLRNQLDQIERLDFIFTQPTFVPAEAMHGTPRRREARRYHIPQRDRDRRENLFHGTEFEIALRNRLTQRAVAADCADWIRARARFRSNRGASPMQAFACVIPPPGAGSGSGGGAVVYQPLTGFTAVDLGYERGDAFSNLITRFDDPQLTAPFLAIFDQLWKDADRLEDVTDRLVRHVAAVYSENTPQRIYFKTLLHIFDDFLDELDDGAMPDDRSGYRESKIWQALYPF